MEWKRMDAYQTLVARLQEKYRARDGAVSALLDEGVPGKLWPVPAKCGAGWRTICACRGLLWQQTQK